MSAKESPIKSDIEEENKETEVPENTIELETPRASADLGESLNVAKLPNYLSVEPKPFDPEEYETEIDDGVTDEEGRARLKSKVENTIRWRYVKDEAGNIMTDEFGEKIRESNARMVKWSDGSLSLHVGSEIFEISSVPIKEHSHLYIRQGAVLQGQAVFENKWTFRPHSTDSSTHKNLSMSSAEKLENLSKTKVLSAAGADPELSKTNSNKKEDHHLDASIRRAVQERKARGKASSRSSQDSSSLKDGMNKFGDGKKRISRLSASAEKDYKSDEEEEWKRKRLQKAKKLADSDDDSSSAEQEPSASQ